MCTPQCLALHSETEEINYLRPKTAQPTLPTQSARKCGQTALLKLSLFLSHVPE